MKVLHVIESLGRGGAERALVNWLPELHKRGHCVEVASLWGPYTLSESLESAGVKVHRLGITHRWNLPQGLSRLTRLILTEEYQIVHAHLFFAGLYSALSKLFAPKPRRLTLYLNLGYDSYPAISLWGKIRKELDAVLTTYAMDGLVAVSKASALSYRKHLRLSRNITVIPLPVDLGMVKPLAEGTAPPGDLTKVGAASGAFTFIMPARMVHEKGHRYLLEALASCKKRGLRPCLVIFGEGPLEEDIRAQTRLLGLSDLVSINGPLPNAAILAMVKASDAVVIASTHEGFPVAAVEALALGKPLLATRVGGISDMVEEGECGVLVPPGDPAALAYGIERIMSDPDLRARLSAAGPKRVAARFTSEVITRSWEKYYEELRPMMPVRTLFGVASDRFLYFMAEIPRRIFRILLCRIFSLHTWHVASAVNKPYLQDMARFLNERGVSSVAEFGCGLGDILSQIDAHRVIGYDTSRDVVQAARIYNFISRKSSEFQVRDFLKDPLPKDAADAWILVNWLHEYPSADIEPRLKELYGRLRPGGMILIDSVSDPGYRYNHDLKRLFITLGAVVTEISPDYGDSRKIYCAAKPLP